MRDMLYKLSKEKSDIMHINMNMDFVEQKSIVIQQNMTPQE